MARVLVVVLGFEEFCVAEVEPQAYLGLHLEFVKNPKELFVVENLVAEAASHLCGDGVPSGFLGGPHALF